jgi:hypothetical protein
MKRLLLLAAIAALAFAQKPKPPSAEEQYRKNMEEMDERWACRIGSSHHCHCPRMVARVEEEGRQRCYKEGTKKQIDECLAKVPDNCTIIQQPDTKEPANTCKRSCSRARCRCWDGPACYGPQLPQPTEPPGDASTDRDPK